MRQEPPLPKGDLSRIVRETEQLALSRLIRHRTSRLPRSLPHRARFLAAKATPAFAGLTDLQRILNGLPPDVGEAQARAFMTALRARATRDDFPGRSQIAPDPPPARLGTPLGFLRRRHDPIYDEARSHWYWVLFHHGDALHLLTDHGTWWLTIGLLAAQYGLGTFEVRALISRGNQARRGPAPGSWRPRGEFTAPHCPHPGPYNLVILCSEHYRTVRSFLPSGLPPRSRLCQACLQRLAANCR